MKVVSINTSSVIPRRKKRHSLVLLQLFIVAVLVAAVWFSFGRNVLSPQKELDVPRQLGTLELISSVEGPEALARINQLHGTDIELESTYIVEYVHGTERATVRVGKTDNGNAAAELTRRMVDGIEMGDSGFSNLRRLSIADHDVFLVDGPGGEHSFYNSRESRERVVWLTIQATDTLLIIEQALRAF